MTDTQKVILQQVTRMADAGVTRLTQIKALIYLNDAERLTHGQVAKRLGISAAAMTGICDKLCNLGICVRMESASDRRQRWIKLTPKGERLVIGGVS